MISALVNLAALAVAAILRAAEEDRVVIVSSAALEAENGLNSDQRRPSEVATLLSRMPERVAVTEAVGRRARELVERGLKPLDALHTACAEQAGCDYLVTTDDQLLRALHCIAGDALVGAADPLALVRLLEGIEP